MRNFIKRKTLALGTIFTLSGAMSERQQPLGDLLAGIKSHDDHWSLDVPSTWMQGRTTYGGLSAAIAHHCARLLVADAPPLRSAQIAFVGPLAGKITIHCELLRRGRNTAFVDVRIRSDAGLGFLATMIFMTKRESALSYENIATPDIGPPPADDAVRNGPPEFFTFNFDYPEKRLTLGENRPDLMSWHRLRQRDGLDVMTQLMCLGDALPPAAMGLASDVGPISSMNWHVNILTDAPETDDGWWCVRAETHHTGDGASSQYMTMWNSRLEPVMTGMQSVALFF